MSKGCLKRCLTTDRSLDTLDSAERAATGSTHVAVDSESLTMSTSQEFEMVDPTTPNQRDGQVVRYNTDLSERDILSLSNPVRSPEDLTQCLSETELM